MRYLLIVLLLLGFNVRAQVPPSDVQPSWTLLQDFGHYKLLIDHGTLHGDPKKDNVSLTVRIDQRQATPNSMVEKYPVKAYVNTLFIECAEDRLTVVVSQMFDPDGDIVGIFRFKTPIPNPHLETTPVTEILDFVCQANPAYPNLRNDPVHVTPESKNGV